MKKYANKMGLVLCVAAVCLMCCLISFSAGQNPETEKIQRLTSLEDMRHELSHIQMFSLPTGLDRVVVDGGTYLFDPNPGDLEVPLFFSLLIPQEAEGLRCWPVTLFEDPESRDTVVLNAEGSEVVRLPCDLDYNPEWAFDMLFPLSPDITDADTYTPARVALTMRLVLREDFTSLRETQHLLMLTDNQMTAQYQDVFTKNTVSATRDQSLEKTLLISDLRIKTLYVDSDTGKDSNSGSYAVDKSRGQGPKKSIQNAIASALTGYVIETRGRTPFTDRRFSLDGKSLVLRPIGSVKL